MMWKIQAVMLTSLGRVGLTGEENKTITIKFYRYMPTKKSPPIHLSDLQLLVRHRKVHGCEDQCTGHTKYCGVCIILTEIHSNLRISHYITITKISSDFWQGLRISNRKNVVGQQQARGPSVLVRYYTIMLIEECEAVCVDIGKSSTFSSLI